MWQKDYQKLQQAVENGTKRIAEIDKLIEKVFEQNAGGVLSDERFAKMLQNYEKEQNALTQEVDGQSHVKVDIYFTAVGMIDIPTEKEILTTMEEIRNNPQDFKFVA